MTEKPAEAVATGAAPAEAPAAPAAVNGDKEPDAAPDTAAAAAGDSADVAMKDAGEKPDDSDKANETGAGEKTETSGDKEVETDSKPADVEMKEPADDTPMADAPAVSAPGATGAAPAAASSQKKAPRKSGGAAGGGKKLNRKGSKRVATNLDAEPGDLFLVKLKGYPPWPAIICDQDMLPQTLLKTRPVTAMRPDGTWAEPYADGGKRMNDRNFAVMYLYTNEFGWIVNSSLVPLTPEKAKESINDRMRKDLKLAYELASEDNSLDFYKEQLLQFQQQLVAKANEKAAAAAAAATPKKGKGKVKAADDDDEADMDEAEDAGDADKSASKAKVKTKKRKAEDEAPTPQRSDSVKKPKIKLNTSSTPKTANSAPATKAAKDDSAAKPAKAKAKKPAKDSEKKDTPTPKEPELSPEEAASKKKREVLYLRHKLQKGLLMTDQVPKEEDMSTMSEYINKLEGYPDLEGWIIRETKIHKVLKAILKLEQIPKEEEHNFKGRSQALLDKWNKILAAAPPAAATTPTAAAAANGVNGADADVSEAKAPKAGVNGVNEAKTEEGKGAGKGASKAGEKADGAEVEDEEKTADAEKPTSEAVEASA